MAVFPFSHILRGLYVQYIVYCTVSVIFVQVCVCVTYYCVRCVFCVHNNWSAKRKPSGEENRVEI